MLNKLVVALLLVVSFSAIAGNNNGGAKNNRKNPVADAVVGDSSTSTLEAALLNQKRVDFIEAQDLQVTALLPDDTAGSPHQKFDVQVSKDTKVTIVSNLDMCPHVPVQDGDKVNVGGQFIPTGHKSGIVHWTHRDPKKKRPDGYIQLGSQTYCK